MATWIVCGVLLLLVIWALSAIARGKNKGCGSACAGCAKKDGCKQAGQHKK